MKGGVTDILKRQLDKGKPLAPLAVAKLRKAGNEAVLKANAGNIIKWMLAGKAIKAEDLAEAERYFPEQAREWRETGGLCVGEKDGQWLNLTQISARIGARQSDVWKMLHAHPDEAPPQRADGKYELDAVRAFYEARSYRSNASLKEQILEQELRLKRVKADEAEGMLIERATVVDILMEADVQLEAALTAMAKKYGQDPDKAISDAQALFKRWREFLSELSTVKPKKTAKRATRAKAKA